MLKDQDGNCRDGDDFVALRDYQHGDSPKHVHWKASAHGQSWLTKVFGGESEARVWLKWEETRGSVEFRLSLLTRWVLDAEAAGISYGLQLPGRSLMPDRGPRHRHRCLKCLALWGIEDA